MVVRDIEDKTVTIFTVVVMGVMASSGSCLHWCQSLASLMLMLSSLCCCCTVWALDSSVSMVHHGGE